MPRERNIEIGWMFTLVCRMNIIRRALYYSDLGEYLTHQNHVWKTHVKFYRGFWGSKMMKTTPFYKIFGLHILQYMLWTRKHSQRSEKYIACRIMFIGHIKLKIQSISTLYPPQGAFSNSALKFWGKKFTTQNCMGYRIFFSKN